MNAVVLPLFVGARPLPDASVQSVSAGAAVTMTPRGDREILVTGTFDAPRGAIFGAWTRPALLARWLRPPGWSLAVRALEPRPDGVLRLVWRYDEDGTRIGLRGRFHAVVQDEEIVHSEAFDEPWYPGGTRVATRLREHRGRTTATTTLTFASRAARNAAFLSPAGRLIAEGYDRLAAEIAVASHNRRDV